MNAIKDNVVGLCKFMIILGSMCLPISLKRYILLKQHIGEIQTAKDDVEESEQDKSKYKELLVTDSEPLIPAESVFCPKCHVLAAQIRRIDDSIQFIRQGRVILTVGNGVIVNKHGTKVTGFPITCPNGHTVRVE